jgi:signal transduction histidine kinase
MQDTDPDAARAAFVVIEQTNQQALGDMRRMLTVLRDSPADDDPLGTGSALNRMPTLIETARSTGLDVDVRILGDTARIPLGVDLSAYRIIQEALTNVMKHASGARVQVIVDAGQTAVTVTVIDDGHGLAVTHRGGHGLSGLQERVAVFGGTFRAERRSPAGFVVSATLPYAASA